MDIHGIGYDDVTPELRSHGKVGELGGGYGMGARALKDYAEKMDIELTDVECKKIITAYREKNPHIKALWYSLNEAMINALQGNTLAPWSVEVGPPGERFIVKFTAIPETDVINNVMTGTQMLEMSLWSGGVQKFWRVWRGCYVVQGQWGSEVIYHKSPISPNHSRLWADHSVDEETGERYSNKLYGGKLTGVLVQSFAREMFFKMLRSIDDQLPDDNYLIGQFHDEAVIDVRMSDLNEVKPLVAGIMSSSIGFPQLPVDCEVKQAYRYTK